MSSSNTAGRPVVNPSISSFGSRVGFRKRSRYRQRWLRRLSLGLALAMGGITVVGPALVTPVEAKKKRKRRARGKAADPKRTIKREGSLAPKREYDLDDRVTQTKNLRADIQEGDRPTLSADDLKRATTEALLDEKLDEEIKLARDLLQFENACDSRSKVEFRLADLYWEKSKRAFFKSEDFSLTENTRQRFAQMMGKLQVRAVKHYKTIVDDCPGYNDYAKTLYYLGRALIEMERPQDGAQYFKRIIKEYPENEEWVANAWFMVGEFYFNTENDARKALKAYKKAADFRDSPIYGFAIYKQGWCHINTSDWDLAMKVFSDVVRLSDDPGQDLDQKGRVSLRKEALKDYVRAYSHVGDSDRALGTFRRVGGTKALPMMLERLGNWYINRDAHSDVMTVYRDLIKSYPRSTRLAIYQGRIVNAASRLGDMRSTVQSAKLLTQYFRKLRERAGRDKLSDEQKQTITKDLREAEDIAENTLRRLAMEYHKEGKKLRGKARDKTYRYAYEIYKHYLTVFPEPRSNADVNYVFFMRFYFAEVLYKLEKFQDAAENYDRVVAMNPTPEKKRERDIVLAAAEESVRSWDELAQDEDRKSPPKISGREPKKIPGIKQKLIDSCTRYIDYVGKRGERIVEIRYKVARIYYTYNHFDRAAPAFDDIVKNHPQHEVACYAANLALDIYNGEKNYRALMDSTRGYLSDGKLSCGEEDRKRFSRIEEQASFQVVKDEYEAKKKYVRAGNAYMAFYRRYPKSEFADDAVYNAAVSYDSGNRLDKANEVRRFLVKTFPNSPLVSETLYNIAQSYERIVDFKNAADYLEQFAAKYPRDKRSRDAIYNAGLYRATLHDFAASRRSREQYIAKYQDSKDAHNVAFSVCESLEEEAQVMEDGGQSGKAVLSKWQEAHDCYAQWTRNSAFTRTDVDLLCQAQFRRGEIMRSKTRYSRGFVEQRKLLFKNWPQWRKKRGLEKLPRCSKALAELKFRDLGDDLKKYRGMFISELNPTKRGKARFDASIRAKVKERDALIGRYKEVVAIGVAEWALAALFSIGEAYQDSIDKLLKAPIPNKIPGYKLTDDDKNQLRQQLSTMAQPIEGLAVEAYQVCVDKANELGVYNKWSVRALDRLQKLKPQEYPLVVERLPTLSFADPLVVAKNGLIIEDGESFKAVAQELKPGVGPPETSDPKPKRKKKQPKQRAQAASKRAAASGSR